MFPLRSEAEGCYLAGLSTRVVQADVERSWNKQASQGQILALTEAIFSTKVFKDF